MNKSVREGKIADTHKKELVGVKNQAVLKLSERPANEAAATTATPAAQAPVQAPVQAPPPAPPPPVAVEPPRDDFDDDFPPEGARTTPAPATSTEPVGGPRAPAEQAVVPGTQAPALEPLTDEPPSFLTTELAREQWRVEHWRIAEGALMSYHGHDGAIVNTTLVSKPRLFNGIAIIVVSAENGTTKMVKVSECILPPAASK